MKGHTGRRRSPRSFANTVAAHSIPRKVHYRTTATQTAEKLQDSIDWQKLMKEGRQPNLNEAIQTAALGVMASTMMDKVSKLFGIKGYALTILKTRDGKVPTQEIELNREQVGVILLMTNPNPRWRTSDGRRILMNELTDDHLDNIINYMYRRQADIDLTGDNRSLERQLITKIWLSKLESEQKRRDNLLYGMDEPTTYDELYPDDTMIDNLCDWPGNF